MGKVSPVSIKYSIKAKFYAEGVVEKPDVIGAIFGQTEGLLGEDLELRELQKNGKIGRINVTLETKDGKTEGEIEIPASLDKAETTIIAAALETIERIGPADVKIRVENIEDVRGNKRDYVLERAKKLLEGMKVGESISRDFGEELTTSFREGKLVEYGKEGLSAGPEIDSSKEIIIVEGRADVLNLLRCGIKNAIAMNGTFLPETLRELSKEKIVTLFVDGDRGGLLNAKGVVAIAKIDFIAQAPIGREVEELSSKEVIGSLRNKQTVEEFFASRNRPMAVSFRDRDHFRNRPFRYGQRPYGQRYYGQRPYEPRSYEQRQPLIGRPAEESIPAAKLPVEQVEQVKQSEQIKQVEQVKQPEQAEQIVKAVTEELTEEKTQKFQAILGELTKTKNACLVDSELKVIRKLSVSELSKLRKPSKAYALVISGTATNNIAKIAEKLGCKHLVAKNFAVNYATTVNLVSV